jgi:GMP synthase PP-ATPase subunit
MTRPKIGGRSWRASLRDHEEKRRALRRKLGRITDNHLTQAHRLQLLAQAAILVDELGEHVRELDQIVKEWADE